jgi:hypothetical protein
LIANNKGRLAAPFVFIHSDSARFASNPPPAKVAGLVDLFHENAVAVRLMPVSSLSLKTFGLRLIRGGRLVCIIAPATVIDRISTVKVAPTKPSMWRRA